MSHQDTQHTVVFSLPGRLWLLSIEREEPMKHSTWIIALLVGVLAGGGAASEWSQLTKTKLAGVRPEYDGRIVGTVSQK
jgi:hypothetical protein